MLRLEQRNRNWKHERQQLLGVVSIHGGKKFAFEVMFNTVHTSCATQKLKYRLFHIFGALTENALSAIEE